MSVSPLQKVAIQSTSIKEKLKNSIIQHIALSCTITKSFPASSPENSVSLNLKRRKKEWEWVASWYWPLSSLRGSNVFITMQLQTLTCLWVKCSAIESSLHQSLDANATLTFMCVCALMQVSYVCLYVCAFVFSLSVGAECTASWEEGCFVQEWAIYSWLFPQQQIIGCSTVIQTTSCIRDCGDTACRENASHTPTALVRFTVQQSKQFCNFFYSVRQTTEIYETYIRMHNCFTVIP